MSSKASLSAQIDLADVAGRYPHIFKKGLWHRTQRYVAPVLALAYFVYAIWFFDFATVLGQGHWDRAALYAADFVSYSLRGTIKSSFGVVSVQWPRFSPLGDDPHPDWVRADGATFVEAQLADGALLHVAADHVLVSARGEVLNVKIDGKTLHVVGPLPAWASLAEDEVDANFGLSGGVEIGPTRTYFSRRFLGWPNFIFAPESKFWGKSFSEDFALIWTGERFDPEQTNLSLAWNDFVTNSNWQHGDVWNAMLQTIIMAFAGTLLAAVLAFPLAFLAAGNLDLPRWLSGGMKNVFNLLRSIDQLIWALFFIRAFGLGPIAGIAAIFLYDIGNFGKLFCEAIENLDKKQREGIVSTGAPESSVLRFGVLPQVLPVFVSQALYHWESNTRSATIIGAVGAGGIGLKLWEAMRTRLNWSNVFYMVLIILLVVYVFDNVSSMIRRRLIGEEPRG